MNIILQNYNCFLVSVLDINTIHEPPRRVFIPISNTELTVSDYLFPGESSPDLLAPLQDLLGISSVNLKNVEDIEGQAGKLIIKIDYWED